MKNPIEPTSKSIESGKIVYDRYCAKCHGVAGKGDGEEAAKVVQSGHPKPSDLTDNKWDHGSTEGEIFVNVRDGVGATGIMKGLNGQPGASATDMWNIVNYLRSLSTARAPHPQPHPN